MPITRRHFVTGFAAFALAASALPSHAGGVLNAPQAYAQATSGKILLIDIRTPAEWAKTGTGAGAKRLDMRRQDFVTALDGLLGGNRTKPIALICARGVRSSRLSRVLREAGYTNVFDVPEGMLGSYAGPGWLDRKLPLFQ